LPDSTNKDWLEEQMEDYIPRQEVDEPMPSLVPSVTDYQLSAKRLELEEKDKDRKDRRYLRAFNLIVGCLVFLGLVYLIDVICSAMLNQGLSSMTEGVIEIIKTLLFTLSGYLFAKKENGD